MKLSNEQLRVVHALEYGNVVVQANPGAGKTSTACAVAEMYPEWKALLITYSSRLKEETRRRVSDNDINQLKVHSYHSCAKWMTALDGHTDEMLRTALTRDFRRECKMDLLILDEQQDQTWLYFEFVCKVLAVFTPHRVLVLGDARQCVFTYKGADARFLTCLPSILTMQEMQLTTSFRMTRQIAQFVNEVLLRDGSITSNRDGEPVTVCTCNYFVWGSFLAFFMREILKYGPGETFVLAPSVRLHLWPIARLQEHLVSAGVPVYFPLFEDGLGREEAMVNKVVFSSFHGSKGRERRLVFVLSFDMSYDMYYNRNGNPYVCSNPMYVAATRAKDKLVMVRSNQMQCPEYVQAERMRELCDMRDYAPPWQGKDRKRRPPKCSATVLVSHQRESAAEELSSMLEGMYVCVRERTHSICIPCSITQEGSEEEVSSVTSLLINDSLQRRFGSSFVETGIRDFEENPKHDMFDHTPNKDLIMTHLRNDTEHNIARLLHRVLVYNAIVNNESFRLAQIKRFDWVSDKQLTECVAAAEANLGIDASSEFEYKLSRRKDCEEDCPICAAVQRDCDMAVHISGTLDIKTDKAIIENKATTAESIEHRLQLIVYKYMWNATHNEPMRFLLYYQLSGITYELVATDEQCAAVVKILVKNKYCEEDVCSDKAFVAKASDIYRQTCEKVLHQEGLEPSTPAL